jgi:glycosyltransferase involved in cell wall biosynthesis
MHAEELVSIIIPMLNEEENIEHVIKSVMAQAHRPLEVIIVDGGSKDGTLKIDERIKREASSESFMIRVLTEDGECRSPANAKNIGFASARGAHVLFADADYVPLDHDFISKVVKALEGSPWVNVKLFPIEGKNNLMSLAQVVMNRTWAPKGYVDERQCFKREFLESNATRALERLHEKVVASLIARPALAGLSMTLIQELYFGKAIMTDVNTASRIRV